MVYNVIRLAHEAAGTSFLVASPPHHAAGAQVAGIIPKVEEETMGSIVLAYRRQDAQPNIAHIYNFLAEAFGSQAIFFPGSLYSISVVEQNLQNAKVMLILIGKGWFGTNDDGTPRIAEMDDMMRAEVKMALELARQGRLATVPVLLDDAPMPTTQQLPPDLADLVMMEGQSAMHIREDAANFYDDINRLIDALSDKGVPRLTAGRIEHPPERMRYYPIVGFMMTEMQPLPQQPSVPVQTAYVRPSSQVHLPTAPAKKQISGKDQAVGLALLLGSGLWGLISRVIITILVIIGGIAIFRAIFPDVGLNEHSSCQQFEQADTNAQNQVLQDMLTAHHDTIDNLQTVRFSVTLYCNIYGESAPIDGIYSSGE